ncbi:MAG TPA: hypothetical protein VK196_10045 [Magnetospirillum sp.]|nr:hypothetical protein [Magnetospirillum sp.]
MSRVGIILCALYALVIAACVASAFSSDDFKGSYVLLQLPIALQIALISALGLAPLMRNLNWLETYALLATPTFAVLYGLGWVLEWPHKGKP